jgi:tRNA-splicing ligase RtcB (3'-phosphate/5'-hydroxy nucleic acid ligase)
MYELAPATYILPQEGAMRVPGLIIATPQLLNELDLEEPLKQVKNVAQLPGIVGYSIAMPDMHWGYGFPIGGVAAMDVNTGVISPGGVGYDINCGVRLALAPLDFKSLTEKQKDQLIHAIFAHVPSGVGHGHRGQSLTEQDFRSLLVKGAKWSVEQGFGFSQDLEHTESHGTIAGAELEAVSNGAKVRGKNQLGTIGSGNHFVEIGTVETIFEPQIAASWGVEEGKTYILIHSGSRGFGHQICQETLDDFIRQGFAENLPDRQLVCAPIQSEAGKKYFGAMAAAANFAFNNRQQILHLVRKAFQETLHIVGEKIALLYDVCHNIAKFETHPFDGKLLDLCVHRKGATRAFGPGSDELSPLFRKTGQPVLVPGDMGRASHLMAGLGNPLTWSTACHGAGRAQSRVQSAKAWKGKNVFDYMATQGVTVLASSGRTVTEEMPPAYKDVDLVVDAVEKAKLAKKVARLKPALVIKG